MAVHRPDSRQVAAVRGLSEHLCRLSSLNSEYESNFCCCFCQYCNAASLIYEQTQPRHVIIPPGSIVRFLELSTGIDMLDSDGATILPSETVYQ